MAGTQVTFLPARSRTTGSLVRLVSVNGPGQFALYTVNSFGTPTALLNSGDGLPDSFTVHRGTHAHGNWAFRAAGTYTVVFEVTTTTAADNAVSSGPEIYTFVVES